jgi:hypothetical protein
MFKTLGWLAMSAMALAGQAATAGTYTCGSLGSIAIDDAVVNRVAGYNGEKQPVEAQVYSGTFNASGSSVALSLISDWRSSPSGRKIMYVWAKGNGIEMNGFMSKPGEWKGYYRTNTNDDSAWNALTCSSN